MARTWHLFPGGNTAAGFVGFFEDLRKQAKRTVILKGGPGVGKSTLMAKVGKQYEKRGLAVGYYHCSGDPDSLDAVLAPEAGFLVLDGTAPHIVDPIAPGAKDGILNLGQCLDEEALSEQEAEITALNKEISACYTQAYCYLHAAKLLREDAAAVYAQALPEQQLRMLEREWVSLLPSAEAGMETHAFAQAITWKGVLQQLDAVMTDTVYCLDAPWGFDADCLLRPVWEAAARRGVGRAAFHDPLEAGKLAHLTAGGATFTTAVLPTAMVFAPAFDPDTLRREASRLAFDRAAFDLMRNQAVEALAQAKARHDALERFYIDAMDYDRLDEIKAAFLEALP